MTGKRIGYIRVSSQDQNPDRQLEGIQLDEKFIEYASAKSLERPVLQEMLRFARKDDEIIVHSVDRLARSVRDLHTIIDVLSPKGIKITFLKQNLVITGHDSPMTILIMTLMGAFAEMERAFIRERQQEGIKIARAKKKYKGSLPKLKADQIVELNKMIAEGYSKIKIARHFKCARQTIYKYLKVKNE